MNDVASTSLVTVRRPTTMLPYDFKQSLEDLARAGRVRVEHVGGDHAVVEQLVAADVPLQKIAKADAADEPEVRTDDRGDRGEASRTEQKLEDARDLAAEGSDGQPTSSRPPSKSVHQRSRVSRSRAKHGVSFAVDAQAGAPLSVSTRKVRSPEPRTSTRTEAPSTRRVVMRAPRKRSKTWGGNARAASLRKERAVLPEIRLSDIECVGRGFVVRMPIANVEQLRALVRALRGAR